MIHHGFKKGKRVLVILDTGEHIVGKFKESTSNYIELEDKKIKWSDVRSSTIYKDRALMKNHKSGVKCMKIEKLQVGQLRTNCYFIIEGNDLIVVDPGDEYEKIKTKIGNHNLKAIFLTHGHFDHNGALEKLLNDNQVQVNPKTISGFNYQIIPTPGHTEDSITFYFPEEKIMFTGDFLFYQNISRTDFPGGNNQEMIKSLEMIKKYDDNIIVYPGHGSETVLKNEKLRFDKHLNLLK